MDDSAISESSTPKVIDDQPLKVYVRRINEARTEVIPEVTITENIAQENPNLCIPPTGDPEITPPIPSQPASIGIDKEKEGKKRVEMAKMDAQITSMPAYEILVMQKLEDMGMSSSTLNELGNIVSPVIPNMQAPKEPIKEKGTDTETTTSTTEQPPIHFLQSEGVGETVSIPEKISSKLEEENPNRGQVALLPSKDITSVSPFTSMEYI